MHTSTFEYLKPTDDQIVLMATCRAEIAHLSQVLEQLVPDGPDKTFLIRKLREVGMWVNVAITRNHDGSPRT